MVCFFVFLDLSFVEFYNFHYKHFIKKHIPQNINKRYLLNFSGNILFCNNKKNYFSLFLLSGGYSYTRHKEDNLKIGYYNNCQILRRKNIYNLFGLESKHIEFCRSDESSFCSVQSPLKASNLLTQFSLCSLNLCWQTDKTKLFRSQQMAHPQNKTVFHPLVVASPKAKPEMVLGLHYFLALFVHRTRL